MCKISVRLVSLRQAISFPEQCSCRARSHPKRDGSRSLRGWGVSSCSFPSPPPPRKPDSAPDAVSSVGFPPFPSAPQPSPAVCSSVLMAGQGRCQQPPLHGVTVGSMCGSSPGDRTDRLGTPGWVSLLLLWLLGMFLSRNNTVPRLPVFVFSNVSAIKISGLGWCGMNFGSILKPWL